MNPRVSVIIPCYNQGQYLDQAIASVLAQTYSPLELIVVDNASTDTTPEVARSYGNRIRYLRLSERGLCPARNAGLDAITGEYWANLDSDNMFEPDFLREMVSFLELERDKPLDFVYCQRLIFSNRETKATSTRAPEFDAALFKRRNFIDANACLLRKASCKGVRFDPSFNHGWNDYDFFMTLLKHGARCARLDKPLVRYRQHESSNTTSVQRGCRQAQLLRQILRKHRGYYSPNDIREARRAVANSIVLTIMARRSTQAGWCQRWGDVVRMIRFASSRTQVVEQALYAINPLRHGG